MKGNLIYQDKEKIQKATDFFKSSVIYVQNIYSALKKLQVNLTIFEIEFIVNTINDSSTNTSFLKEHLHEICLIQNVRVLEGIHIANIRSKLINGMPSSFEQFRFEFNLMDG